MFPCPWAWPDTTGVDSGLSAVLVACVDAVSALSFILDDDNGDDDNDDDDGGGGNDDNLLGLSTCGINSSG